MIKLTILLKRNSAMTHDEFVTYHREHHADLFMSVPVVQANVAAYVQQHTVDESVEGLPTAPFDGVTELWFEDAENIRRLFTDEEYLRVIRPDEMKFCDVQEARFMVTVENVVKARSGK